MIILFGTHNLSKSCSCVVILGTLGLIMIIESINDSKLGTRWVEETHY